MPPPSLIPGYGLAEPGEGDARAALGRVFGAGRGEEHWDAACRAAGLVCGHVSARPQFEAAVQALAGQGGAASTVARSLQIRLRTYDRLAVLAAAGNDGGRG